MSHAQWIEEQEYNRDDSAYLEAMRADNVDYFGDEQAYYCAEHDYLDYNNECPHGHAEPEPEPEPQTYLPEFEPPF